VNLTLVRFSYGADCTLGFLHAGDLRLATLEEPWIPDPDGPGGQARANGLKESCIPDGVYNFRPHSTARFPDVYAIVNPALGVWYQPNEIPPGRAWGRSAILLHAGNVTADTLGCILVGTRHGKLEGDPAVLNSRQALEQLRAVLGRHIHTLVIRPTAGTQEIAA
jgi:hypothetical protein